MIVIAGNIGVKSQTRADAVKLLIWFSQQTRNEVGCIVFGFSSVLEDENTMLVFEEWESDEHLKAHFQTDHMKEFQSQMKTLGSGVSSVKRYVVTEHGLL